MFAPQNISMKKNLLLFLIFLSFHSFSQYNWDYLHDVDPEPNRYDDVYFTDSLHGWACGPQTVIHTNDGGMTWDTQAVNLGYARSIEFLDENTGFLGTLDSKLFKTINGGLTWLDITDSLASPSSFFNDICGINHVGDTIIAVGNYHSGAYIHISYDKGLSWSFKNMDTLASHLIDVYFFNSRHGLISGSSTDSLQDGIILETMDGGISWRTAFRSHKTTQYVWKLQHVNDHLMVGSLENRLNLTDTSFMIKSYDNGQSWEMKPVVSFNIEMQGIGFLNDSIGFCGGWSPGMYKTTDGGNTWNYYNIGANLNRFFVLSPTLAYASGQVIYKYIRKENASINDSKAVLIKSNCIKNLFPNPLISGSMLNIEYVLARSTNIFLELISNEGKKMDEILNEYETAGTKVMNYRLPNLPNGTYHILLGTDEMYDTKKIVIQN